MWFLEFVAGCGHFSNLLIVSAMRWPHWLMSFILAFIVVNLDILELGSITLCASNFVGASAFFGCVMGCQRLSYGHVGGACSSVSCGYAGHL